MPPALTVFLVVITNFLLLIGAGLFSKAVGSFEENAFNHLLGSDVDDSGGTGPGSYRVQGNIWHLDCCSSTDTSNEGWSIFTAIFGWSNNGSRMCIACAIMPAKLWTDHLNLVGTVLSYIFYWIAIIAVLVIMKFREVGNFIDSWLFAR